MLTARKSDLELQLQMINQSRLQLSNMLTGLFTAGMNLDPNGAQAQQMQSRISALQQIDKMMEMQGRQIDTQHQAVQTELEAVSKVIQKNISSSFKLMG